jgi:hypothetical protein
MNVLNAAQLALSALQTTQQRPSVTTIGSLLDSLVIHVEHLNLEGRRALQHVLRPLLARLDELDPGAPPSTPAEPPAATFDASQSAWESSLLKMLQDAQQIDATATTIESESAQLTTDLTHPTARLVAVMQQYAVLTREFARHLSVCPTARAEFEVEFLNAQA